MKIARFALNQFDHSVLSALTRGSFFGSSDFMQIWESVGGHPVVWCAETEGKVAAVLPGVEFGRAPVKRFQSMPDGCYGQIYFDSSVIDSDRKKIAATFSEVLCEADYAKVFLFDYFGTFVPSSDMTIEPCSTQLVDIAADWVPPDKKLQSEIRKAEREGVVIAPFDSARCMERFLDLMHRTEERHQRKPKYPPEFFTALAKLATESPNVLWTWCEHDGKAVSSHISFRDNNMLLNWQVYFDKAFSFLKANQLTLYSVATRAASQGVEILNLGASPPEAGGLSSYKEKWGARVYEYNCFSKKNLLGRLV